MYSFLIKAKIFGPERYTWFTYTGRKPVEVSFRGNPVTISKGTRFGIRPSSTGGGKFLRLVLEDAITKVMTVPMDIARALAKSVE